MELKIEKPITMRVPSAAAIAMLHALPPSPRTVLSMQSLSPLFDFAGGDVAEALTSWERIDDVIMGGVSSSRLVAAEKGEGVVFEGRLRSDGGGFCGQRMRLLAEPLDLSSSDGMFIDCEATNVGADPSKRVWKMAIRTKQDRGEVVYQAPFTPPATRTAVQMPFSSFRLVRGPRLVPGVPPLESSMTNETYQVSIVVSKFEVSETGAALQGFEEGLFALKLFGVGTYVQAEAPVTAAPKMPRALTEAEQKAAAPVVIKLLRPLLGLLFGETTRRRRAATNLLEKRGTSRLARFKLAWAWRASGKAGVFGALRKTLAVGLRDASGQALSLPIRLLFKTLGLVRRSIKAVKNLTSGGQKDGLQAKIDAVPLK